MTRFLVLAALLVACSSPNEEPGASTGSAIRADDGALADDDDDGSRPGYTDDDGIPRSSLYELRGNVGAHDSADIEIHLGAEGVARLLLSGLDQPSVDDQKVVYTFDGNEYPAAKTSSEMRFQGTVDSVLTVTVRNDGPGSISFISSETGGDSEASGVDIWCNGTTGAFAPDVRPDSNQAPYCFSAE